MNEQPYLLAHHPWMLIRDGNPTGMAIFRRHYTARKNRKIFQFVGPGEKMVLITPDARALFVWRKFISDAGESGVNCAVFRNEGSSEGISSALIIAAKELAWQRWPNERLYTYVDAGKVRHKRDPGRCFIKAGFRRCGQTKDGKLIFEDISRVPVEAGTMRVGVAQVTIYSPPGVTPRNLSVSSRLRDSSAAFNGGPDVSVSRRPGDQRICRLPRYISEAQP